MQEILTGTLFHTKKFGWQVRYEFGYGQSKCLHIHRDLIEDIKKNGVEGKQVKFKVLATIAKRSLNGSISSAYIINDEEK